MFIVWPPRPEVAGVIRRRIIVPTAIRLELNYCLKTGLSNAIEDSVPLAGAGKGRLLPKAKRYTPGEGIVSGDRTQKRRLGAGVQGEVARAAQATCTGIALLVPLTSLPSSM